MDILMQKLNDILDQITGDVTPAVIGIVTGLLAIGAAILIGKALTSKS